MVSIKHNAFVSQCSFKLPNKSKWRGHPFYYQCLDTIQKVNNKMPDTINEILSLPLWHNKFIKSYFDCDLSRKGFNCIKDIFSVADQADRSRTIPLEISKNQSKKIQKIKDMPPMVSKI